MDIKKLVNSLSDKPVTPILIVVIVGVSYLAFSVNMKAENTKSELVFLVSKLKERDSDQSFSGTRIPNALLTQITSQLKAEERSEIKYWVLQFISTGACTPCTQEEIDFFRRVSRIDQRKVKFFFVVDDTSSREINTLKHGYRIDFAINFVSFEPADFELFYKSATLLTTNDGTILLRFTTQPEDTLRNTLKRKVLQQFVNN